VEHREIGRNSRARLRIVIASRRSEEEMGEASGECRTKEELSFRVILVDVDRFVVANGFCDATAPAVWTLDWHVGDVGA
jgi:hypothetical protein